MIYFQTFLIRSEIFNLNVYDKTQDNDKNA